MRRIWTTIGSILTDLLFPPRCAGCGALLPPFRTLRDGSMPMLCSTCRPAWDRALSRDGDRLGAVWLVPYKPEEPEAVPQQVLFRLKHRDDRRLTDWLAAALAKPVREALRSETSGNVPVTVVVLYPPRRRAAVRRDGFDQAKRLACALARQLNAVCLPAIRRVSDGAGAQKTLDAAGRKESAASSYALDERYADRLTGCCVVLVDDLFTTGATLSRLALLARSAGCAHVLIATVARTYRRSPTETGTKTEEG